MAEAILLENLPGNDQILVICNNGDFYTTSFDTGNHYEDDIFTHREIPGAMSCGQLYCMMPTKVTST